MFGLYGVILRLAWAVVLPYQIVIARLHGRRGPRLGERLARGRDLEGLRSDGFWVHAVSVGEVRIALALVGALRVRCPGVPFHLTVCTDTGRALADEARLTAPHAAPDSISDLPIDLPGPIGRFLDRLRPRLILIVETEIWPNLFRVASSRSIPVLLVNGRISQRTYPRYLKVRPLLARVLGGVRLFAMQSAADATRVRSLGAPAERITVTGNVKYDLPLPRVDPSAIRRRLGAGPGDFLFVAGSTAPGEESAIIDAFKALRCVRPEARLILAPRHPEARQAAADALHRADLPPLAWSSLRPDGPPFAAGATASAAVLVDTLGVLPEIYAAASLVFVGGSLVPRGGQNLLEPAALGRAVLFGPHIENFRPSASALIERGGGFMATDAAALRELVLRLAADDDARAAAGALAREVVESHRGALQATVNLVAAILDPAPSGRMASGVGPLAAS